MRIVILGVEVSIPIVTLLVLPAMAAVRGVEILPPVLAVTAHELGHIVAARQACVIISSMRVTPFGASIKTDELITGKTELFVSLSGPCASIVFATLCAGLTQLISTCADGAIAGEITRRLVGCTTFSLMLFALNMLPALPLDGGRILRSVLSARLGLSTAHTICCALGFAVSAALITVAFCGWPSIVPAAAFMGLLVLFEVLRELRMGAMASMTASFSRCGAFARSGRTKLSTVAMRDDVKARSAVSTLKGATLIAVMDADMGLLGTLGEGDLIRGMVEHGSEITLGKLLQF